MAILEVFILKGVTGANFISVETARLAKRDPSTSGQNPALRSGWAFLEECSLLILKGDTAKSGRRPASAKAAARERAMRRSVQNNIHYYNMDVK